MKREPNSASPRIHPDSRSNLSPNTPLLKALTAYQGLHRRRFHVPGHAGLPLVNSLLGPVPGLPADLYPYDQTEVEGLDVLSEPSECIRDAQMAAAEAFDVRDSFFLVNGSTAGILTTMLAALQPGDEVLLPRNIHRSVISGLILTGARPIWFLPDWLEPWGLWSPIQAAAVQALLKQHPNAKLLLITSPTYEGLGSDVEALGALCREQGVYFIVDEAHGSLWPFSEALPTSACNVPCDGVIHSLHKTGGSLTQSSLLHLPQDSLLETESVQQALNTVQTTSPSYLLMASLDATRAYLASAVGQARIGFLLEQVAWLRQTFQETVQGFELFAPPSELSTFWDPTKLYLRSLHEPGDRWAVRLEADCQLAYEATSSYGSLYLAGLGLEPDDYAFFLQVFQAAEKRQREALYTPTCPPLPLPLSRLLPREAFFAKGHQVSQKQAVGRIAKETVVHCPPGIPVILPGEEIQAAHQPYLPERVWVVA